MDKGTSAKRMIEGKDVALRLGFVGIKNRSQQDIIDRIVENAPKIVTTFRNEEIAERQRQMSKSPHKYKSIEKKLGLTIQFPSAYRISKESENFFWIRKDITTGTTNLMIFEVRK